MRTLLITLTLALLTSPATAQEPKRPGPTLESPWVGHYVAELQETSVEGVSQAGEILLYDDLTCTINITIRWQDGDTGTIRSRECSYRVKGDTVHLNADATATNPDTSVWIDKTYVMGDQWQFLSEASPQPALVFERR